MFVKEQENFILLERMTGVTVKMELIRCLIYLVLLGVISFLLGRCLPKKWFHEDGFLYRSHDFEKNGRFYKRLHIQKWKHRVPDMSRIFSNLVIPKKIDREAIQKLPEMIRETCISEFIHVFLCIAGFYCLQIWEGAGGLIVALIFMAGNIPFILIQRYNRPRLRRLKEKLV